MGKIWSGNSPAGRHRLTLVLDPRFPGGTAGAVAEEVLATYEHVDLRLCGIETTMFAGRFINPRLAAALERAGIELEWNPRVIRGDTVVFHNPSCLRYDTSFAPRISCSSLYVVTHENFLRPNGSEGFDVEGCVKQIERAVVTGEVLLAPVSGVNRRGVAEWLSRPENTVWSLAEFDWFNICASDLLSPAAAPRDRRGRHSRSGLEKFPPLETMLAHFPSHAEQCILLGADLFLREPGEVPRHWTALPFGEMEVARFLEEIDFFIYFTHPLWRESFGRAVAEAIAAGKLVITDPVTAGIFGPGVVASEGRNIDAIVEHFVAHPAAYAKAVRQAQAMLQRWRPEMFREGVLARVVGERVGSIEPHRHSKGSREAVYARL